MSEKLLKAIYLLQQADKLLQEEKIDCGLRELIFDLHNHLDDYVVTSKGNLIVLS